MDPGGGGSGGGINEATHAYGVALANWEQIDKGDITIPEWWELDPDPSAACQILNLIKKTSVLVQWIACFENHPAPRSPEQETSLQNCVDTAFANGLADMAGCVASS